MLDPDTARDIFDDVLGRLPARQDGEVRLEGGEHARVVAEDARVTSHIERQTARLVLRLGEPKRRGWAWVEASTDALDEAALDTLVDHAKRALREASGEPDALGPWSPPPTLPPPPDGAAFVDDDLAATGPAFRVHRVADPVLDARRWQFRAHGSHHLGFGGFDLEGTARPYALATSRGVFHHGGHSAARTSIRIAQPQRVPGWSMLLSREGPMRLHGNVATQLESRLAWLEPLLTTDPKIRPSRFDPAIDNVEDTDVIVLSAPAVSAVIEPVLAALSGASVVARRSPLTDVGQDAVLGEQVSIRCDVSHPLHGGRPFDLEGLPTQVVSLVENGVVDAFVYGRHAAVAAGVEPTGHTVDPDRGLDAVRYPVMSGVEDGGDALDLLDGVKDALLVDRLEAQWPGPDAARPWSIPLLAVGGAVRVQDGDAIGVVPPFSLTIDLDVLLRAIERRGAARRVFGAVVPPVRVTGMRRQAEVRLLG